MDVPRTTGRRRAGVGALAVVGLVVTAAALTSAVVPQAAQASPPIGIFADDLQPAVSSNRDRGSVELGVRFTPEETGVVTALQYYQGGYRLDVTTATLWSGDGKVLSQVSFAETDVLGWRTIPLTSPVSLEAGRKYVVSYHANSGAYPSISNDLSVGRTQNGFELPASAGVYAYGSEITFPTQTWAGNNYLVDVVFVSASDPATSAPGETSSVTATPTSTPTDTPLATSSPTTTPSATSTPTRTPETTSSPTETAKPSVTPTPTTSSTAEGGIIELGRSFPSSATTGVPAGTAVTAYTGPCSIQADNTVIDAKTINCDLRILAQNVKITRSVLNGTIYSDPDYFNGSFSMTDSEVRMKPATGTGIGEANFVITRVEVTGGSRSINCASNCTVQDSYLHGQYTDQRGIDHESGVRIGFGSVLRHNTITCDATPVPPDAGCSAAITGYGDFAIVQKNTIDNNLIDGGPYGSMGYCAYGGSTTGKPFSVGVNNIKFTNNIFKRGPNGKCGIWGPITSFDSDAPGNVWTNNLWDDGKPVPPAD